MINGGLINGREINGALTGDTPTGTPTTITRAIEITLATPVTITRPIIINAAVPVTLTRAIEINAHAFNTLPGNAINWTVTVLIDGVDYSARLTGLINISRAVNAATLADVALVPVAGVISPTAFDGKNIEIRYQDARGQALLFKGKVIRPVINMADKVLRLTCSDLLQETVGKLSTAQIDAIIPHQRSPAIYSDTVDVYDYALQCLKSAEGDIFLNLDGQLTYQPWVDSGALAFDQAFTWYGSVEPRFADRHSLINTVNVTVDYRHFIGWHREHALEWGIPHTYPAWVVVYISSLPSIEMIEQAIPADCVLSSKTYTPPPPSGFYTYFGTDAAFINSYPANFAAYKADIKAAERWLQTVTHTLNLTITAPASVGQYQAIEQKVSYTIKNEEAAIDFATINDGRTFGTNAGYDNDGPVTVSDKLPPAEYDQIYIDWRVKNYRKKLFGKNGTEAAAAGAMTCILRESAKTILASHQNVSIDLGGPIQPTLSLANAISLNSEGVTATGRINALTHSMSIDSGEVTTKMTVVPVSGAINQTLTPPAIIDQVPGSVAGTAPVLGLHLKDPMDATPDNDDWRGYVGNYITQTEYNERFVVEIPAIPDALREELVIEQNNAYIINVTLDKIGLSL